MAIRIGIPFWVVLSYGSYRVPEKRLERSRDGRGLISPYLTLCWLVLRGFLPDGLALG